MNFWTNMNIGRKMALVLGGIVVLLTALSALSLWGAHSGEKQTQTLIQQLDKARLTRTISGESSAVAQNVGRMVFDKKINPETVALIHEIRANRKAALEKYTQSAQTPAESQSAAEMAELIQAIVPANEHIMAALRDGHVNDVAKEFRTSITLSNTLAKRASEISEALLQNALSVDRERRAAANKIWMLLIFGSLIAISAAIFGGIFLTRSIAIPLAATVAHLGEIANGNLSQDAPANMQARGDEIGMLARVEQKMTVSLRDMIREVTSGIEVLSASSTQLMASSTEMSSGSRQASDKAHSVSAAAEQMSANIASVAAGMEETTTNLAQVASATDQMTSTIGEIAQNSEKARRITDDATKQAARITEQISQLGAAAREIGKVTETITEISSQTNLLALNATIEAARAGAAGKGFAVVATEIKALAQQTAAATEDIKTRIAGVQTATSGGISEIGKVAQVISEVSSIVSSIAAAIEEQSISTKDIARNVSEASLGVNDANSRVAETSQVSREIAKDIVTVDQAAGEMANGSTQVRTSAGELSHIAEGLKATVVRFRS